MLNLTLSTLGVPKSIDISQTELLFFKTQQNENVHLQM